MVKSKDLVNSTVLYVFIGIMIAVTIALIIYLIYNEKYNSSEHVLLGNGNPNTMVKDLPYEGVVLKLPDTANPSGYKEIKGSELKYITNTKHDPKDTAHYTFNFGEVLALAGDFYGIPESPIAPDVDPSTNLVDEKFRFMDAFDTFDKNEDTIEFFKYFRQEMDVIKDVQAKCKLYRDEKHCVFSQECSCAAGETMWDNFNKSGYESDIKFNKETGGISDHWPGVIKNSLLSLMIKGRYLRLAENNIDHFCQGGHALYAYLAGHICAMEEAVIQSKNPSPDLTKAYALEAYACHFLTDMFASGHLRVERKLIVDYGTSYDVIGNYLTKLMHDEDNKLGLSVSNFACSIKDNSDLIYVLGNSIASVSDIPKIDEIKNIRKVWKCYGDKYLTHPDNQENLGYIGYVMQKSVDEVWKSFETGKVLKSKIVFYLPDFQYTENVPILDKENNVVTQYSVLPLYSVSLLGKYKHIGDISYANQHAYPMFIINKYDSSDKTLYRRVSKPGSVPYYTSVLSGVKAVQKYKDCGKDKVDCNNYFMPAVPHAGQ